MSNVSSFYLVSRIVGDGGVAGRSNHPTGTPSSQVTLNIKKVYKGKKIEKIANKKKTCYLTLLLLKLSSYSFYPVYSFI